MERINTKATEKTKKIILDKTKKAQEAKDQENGEKFLQFLGTLSLYPYVFMELDHAYVWFTSHRISTVIRTVNYVTFIN